MQAVFYINTEPIIKVNKTLGTPVATITNVKTLEGLSSIDNPILRVKNLPVYHTANYVYIDTYNSYYSIDDRGEEQGGFLLLYLKVDVLMTDRIGINNSTGHIFRSSQGSKWTPDPLCIIGDKSTWNHETIGDFATYGSWYVIVKGGP